MRDWLILASPNIMHFPLLTKLRPSLDAKFKIPKLSQQVYVWHMHGVLNLDEIKKLIA